MLKWLRKSRLQKFPKRYVLISQLFFFSFLSHCLILISFFYMGKEQTIQISLMHIAYDRPIVFVPLAKTTGILNNKGAVAKSSTVAKPTTLQLNNVPIKNKKESKQLKKTIKKEVASKTKLAAKTNTKPETKKETVIKQKPAKPTIDKTQKQKNEPEIIKKDQNILPQLDVINTITSNEQIQTEEVIYVGRNDYDCLLLYQEVLSAITPHWQPPVGMGLDTQCSLKVSINKNGIVETIDIAQSSKIFVYDSAARRAIMHTTFPKVICGKTILVTFNQR